MRTLDRIASSTRVGSAFKASDSMLSKGTNITTNSGERSNWFQYSFSESVFTCARIDLIWSARSSCCSSIDSVAIIFSYASANSGAFASTASDP